MMSNAPFVAAFVSRLSVPAPLRGAARTAALTEVLSTHTQTQTQTQTQTSLLVPAPMSVSIALRDKADHAAFVGRSSGPTLLFPLPAIRPNSLGPEGPPAKSADRIRTGHRP